ncbi:MAG: PQQ-binding-like beta-propeller repeat protein [Candidatus Krumholzibacteria bacterium]
MIHREITFYPETESARDLIYSEYTSCERSIHVLLQDNNLPNYRFLLEAYREIVSRYASMSKLQSPTVFLRDLAAGLEEIARRLNFTLEDLRAAGFYVLLRSTEAWYLMASREDDIHLHRGGELLRLADLPAGYVERIHVAGGALQEELFPQKLSDGFVLLRLDPRYFGGGDILLGCGDEEKNAVMEIFTDPMCVKTGRATVSSKFITRKMLAVRFELHAAIPDTARRRFRVPGWRRMQRRVAVTAVLGTALLVSALWLRDYRGRTPSADGPPAAGERVAGAGGGALEAAGAPDEQERYRLAERWRKSQSQPVTSSPVGYGKWVVYGARNGRLSALDRESGGVVWTVKSAGGIGASPAVAGKNVVVADYRGQVRLLHADTGKEIWKRTLPQRVVSSPCIMGGRVLVGCYDGFAYCLDMGDGRVLWKRGTRGRIRGSSGAGQGRFYVPSYDGYVYALAGETGKVRWRHRLGGNIAGAAIPYGDRVIVGAPTGEVYALRAEDGSVLWRYQTGDAVKSSAVVVSGRVYVGSNDHHVYCLNLADGKLIWKYKTGDVVLSRPAVYGGRVFVGSYDQYMYCLDAMTGALIDRYRADGAIYSSPLVEDGAVFFGTNKGSFICLTLGTGSAL